jgi:UDP-glucose 4-epimerase
MRVLVTGGAGYIGSVLSELLVHAKHHVTVLDDLSTGYADAVPSAATFVRGNLLDTELVTETLRAEHIDTVVHMAGRSLIGESTAETYRDNVSASLSLLDAMRTAGVKVLVFSSTASVYGEPAKQPIEEGDPTQPINAYGETKLTVERALPWHEEYGLRWISLRYFNAAGATARCGERHDPETHLVPLVLQCAAGERGPIVIHGHDYSTPDGTCVRDWVDVSDLAHAHVLAATSLEQGGPSRIYNLGGGKGYSVRDVIHAAEEVVGAKIPFTIGSRRAGDPAMLVASSARIRAELGWHPTRDLRTMVADAWQFLRRE